VQQIETIDTKIILHTLVTKQKFFFKLCFCPVLSIQEQFPYFSINTLMKIEQNQSIHFSINDSKRKNLEIESREMQKTEINFYSKKSNCKNSYV
jgi:hypothetical protein